MTYQEVLANARTCMGNYCKSCPVCNGMACKNQIPGPGAKGLGTGFIRNYQKWQEICVNMDTIGEGGAVDTSLELFGKKFEIPVPTAPKNVEIEEIIFPPAIPTEEIIPFTVEGSSS